MVPATGQCLRLRDEMSCLQQAVSCLWRSGSQGLMIVVRFFKQHRCRHLQLTNLDPTVAGYFFALQLETQAA